VIGWRYQFDLVYELTKKELKVRYKSSVLGYLWSILNPLAMAGVFYVGLGLIIGVRGDGRHPFWLALICGMFPWQWFSNSINACTNVYVGNANLIRKVAFRRELLPLATVLNDLIHFAVSIPVIVAFLLLAGDVHGPSAHWLYGVPLLMLAQLIMAYALGLIAGTLNVLFRDLSNLVAIFLTTLFYVTPIIYSIDHGPIAERIAPYRGLILANPAAALVAGWKSLFLDGRFDFAYWSLATMYALGAAAVAQIVHVRLRGSLTEAA